MTRVLHWQSRSTPDLIERWRGIAASDLKKIRALLHDLAVLAADYEADVSRGFVRGETPWLRTHKTG